MMKKSAFDECSVGFKKSIELQSNIDALRSKIQRARALDLPKEFIHDLSKVLDLYRTELAEARAALNAHLVTFIDERRLKAGLKKSEATVEQANGFTIFSWH